MLPSTQNGREQGFTLVELAIVLVIVGLLIGGILKGQELIASTRATSTASMISAVEAGSTNFFDTYSSVPGDMANPSMRLPNCATAGSVCNIAGDGTARINQAPGAAMAIGALAENVGFFGHLAAAELIGGVSPTATALTVVAHGVLSTPLGRGSFFRVGYHDGAAVPGGGLANPPAGHYLAITSVPIGTVLAAAAIENTGITPRAANKIDEKYDDGMPRLGSVIGAGNTAGTATTGCEVDVGGGEWRYNTRDTQDDCGLYVQIMK